MKGILHIFPGVALWLLAIVLTSGIAVVLLANAAAVAFFCANAGSETARDQIARTLMSNYRIIKAKTLPMQQAACQI